MARNIYIFVVLFLCMILGITFYTLVQAQQTNIAQQLTIHKLLDADIVISKYEYDCTLDDSGQSNSKEEQSKGIISERAAEEI